MKKRVIKLLVLIFMIFFTVSVSALNKTSCGDIDGIPKKIPELTSYAITVIQVAVPIVLTIMSSMDLFRGITAGKEDEIKKGQHMFVKRIIVAAIIFFVVIIVKFLISVVADANQEGIVDCVECFINGKCGKSI